MPRFAFALKYALLITTIFIPHQPARNRHCSDAVQAQLSVSKWLRVWFPRFFSCFGLQVVHLPMVGMILRTIWPRTWD
ncbi:hypothetical protein M431DRAFT_523485, partial [Trichoderma harzianum CBS 226.95]